MTRVMDLNLETGELFDHHSLGVAYVLWLFTGLFGGHWLYLKRPGLAALYLLTCGVFGIGWLIDMFNMPDYVRHLNQS